MNALTARKYVQVIGLAAGQPDFPTPEPIAKAGQAAIANGITTYTPNTGTAALRSAIVAKLATDNGLQYSTDEIVVTNGAKQAIWQAVLACVSPGDEVIVPAPYWVSYPEMVRLAGGTPVVAPTSAHDDFGMTAEQLRQAMSDKTRLIILCTPSNPSGMVYSAERQAALAEVIQDHPRALVISDEIYELITYAPAKHVSFASLPGMWERTFTINGVSKAFAMTGWRIGYLAAPRHFAKAAAVIQSQSTSGACSISQVCTRAQVHTDTSSTACQLGNIAALAGDQVSHAICGHTVAAHCLYVGVASVDIAIWCEGGVCGRSATWQARRENRVFHGQAVRGAQELHCAALAGDRGPHSG